MVHVQNGLSDRQKRKRAARTEKILDAASRILIEEGLAALTIHRLADDLDYAVGALYRYFPSKDAILAEVERRVVEAFGTTLNQIIRHVEAQMAKQPPLPSVRSLVLLLAHAQFYQQLPELAPQPFTLIGQHLANPQPLVSQAADLRVLEVLMPLLNKVAKVFVCASQSKSITPGNAQQRALIYWAGLHGASQLQKLRRLADGFAPVNELTCQTAENLLQGWGASAGDLKYARNLLADFLRPGALGRALGANTR